MSDNNRKIIKGRGTTINPTGRFERITYIPDEDIEIPSETQLFRDTSKNIISYNTSPDIPYNASLNPYRGCEHG
ncbi:MAG: radical SAM protein, partial [Candidatus Marinimicrobia bacterium]|nr:radical SAM protein [Candidatus Neomarinimicrobiota bacterium]MCF7840739.1 radical SAM protein [Candidatus Neomarinimicrobiota bacterium]